MVSSLQLYNKADLQTVMKAGRWSGGGTFTSFYLRHICHTSYRRQSQWWGYYLIVLLGKLFFFAVCLVDLWFPLPPSKRGVPVAPIGSKIRRFSICARFIVFAALEPEQADCQPLLIKFWIHPKKFI